jgi:hypothetical protein
LEADSIMMMGDSTIQAREEATAKAARFSLGAARRAMTAARKGPSAAIMSHVASRGSQNRTMRPAGRPEGDGSC